MRFAIVGCGNAGSQRAAAISSIDSARIAVCVDPIEDRASALAARYDAQSSTDWREAITRSDVDAVVIAAANYLHTPIALAAAEAGKHILCERPLARNRAEAEQIIATSRDRNVRLQAGLSHRHHPAIEKARSVVDSGQIGSILYITGKTGRGGFSTTPPSAWMTDCELSGGGTLLDNGIDLLDMCRYFMEDFRWVQGYAATLVWPIHPCEDNAFALLTTAEGRVASIHSSWTDWQSYMYFEITGTKGYIKVNYDDAIVTLGSETGLEDTFDVSAGVDESLSREVEELMTAAASPRAPLESAHDALEALILAQTIYRSSESGRAENI